MSSCCRLAIQLPMDALLPEDPQEENNTTTAAAMEGETASGENLELSHGTSKEGQQKDGSDGDVLKEGEIGGEMKQPQQQQRPEGVGSGEGATVQATGSAPPCPPATGKGRHASGGGRKPRTKGTIKKLQEQVIMKYRNNLCLIIIILRCCCFIVPLLV